MGFFKKMLEELHSSGQRLKKKKKEKGKKKNREEKIVKSPRLAEIIFQKKRAWGWGRAGRRLSGCGKV